jgi:hypothetical protein
MATLVDIISNLRVESPLLHTNDEVTLNVSKPSNIDIQLPKIPQDFLELTGLELCDNTHVEKYFNDLLGDSMRVMVINGFNLSAGDCYYCDYCNTHIEGNWYYCNCCHRDMCKLCYDEPNMTDEESKDKGVQYRKYREKAITYCLAQNQFTERNDMFVCDGFCNSCDSFTNDMQMYTGDGYDLCISCSKKNPELIEENKLTIVNFSYQCDKVGFGSMLSWFPLLRGGKYDDNYLFINLNRDDKNYHKLCLSAMDDHGRTGYYMINEGLEDFLEELKVYHNVVVSYIQKLGYTYQKEELANENEESKQAQPEEESEEESEESKQEQPEEDNEEKSNEEESEESKQEQQEEEDNEEEDNEEEDNEEEDNEEEDNEEEDNEEEYNEEEYNEEESELIFNSDVCVKYSDIKKAYQPRETPVIKRLLQDEINIDEDDLDINENNNTASCNVSIIGIAMYVRHMPRYYG